MGIYLALLAVLLALLYYMWSTSSAPSDNPTGELPTFTLEQLATYNSRSSKTYLGCNGLVFDVSSSDSYREGGSYSKLAGRDASVALARMDLSDESLSKRLSEVELTAEQQNSLESWGKFFANKGYRVVGKIAS